MKTNYKLLTFDPYYHEDLPEHLQRQVDRNAELRRCREYPHYVIASIPAVRAKENGATVLSPVISLYAKGVVRLTYLDDEGYACIGLSKDGKESEFRISRLVAMAFIPNDDPEGLPEVGHKDENKANNLPGNLYWTCRIEQMSRPLRIFEREQRKLQNAIMDDLFMGHSAGQVIRNHGERTLEMYRIDLEWLMKFKAMVDDMESRHV